MVSNGDIYLSFGETCPLRDYPFMNPPVLFFGVLNSILLKLICDYYILAVNPSFLSTTLFFGVILLSRQYLFVGFYNVKFDNLLLVNLFEAAYLLLFEIGEALSYTEYFILKSSFEV